MTDAAPTTVYPLWHMRPLGDSETDDKLLGIYATREEAERRMESARKVAGFKDYPDAFVIDGYEVGRDEWVEGFVTDDLPDRVLLTADEAFRATFRFIAQYYAREPITPFLLMLTSMTAWDGGDQFSRSTSDPATWDDWMKSVEAAIADESVPEIPPPTAGDGR